jgi:hypothetical protein
VKKTRAFLVVWLVACGTAAAQAPTGTLRGFIQDASNAVMPGVDVEIIHIGTGARRSTVTDGEGRYDFSFVPVGRYRLGATIAGFKTVAREFTLEVDQTLRLDLTMEVGVTSETLTVVGDAPLVQTNSSSTGTVIDSRKMVDIPLNSRDFQQLTLLVPGSVVPAGGDVTFNINVAGQRGDANDFLIDGTTNNDLRNNQIVLPPNVETIQEFKIQENSFSAEYGRASGAVVNIVTRSGANEFDGSVFHFLRNERFDARNYFDDPNVPIPPFKRNVFGGVLGGPIVRNKSFFFFSYEGRRQRESVTLRSRVPTAQERSGIIRNADGSVTNVSAQIDPVARRLLDLVPLPNSEGAFNWVGIGKRPRDVDQYSIKVDHDFNSSHRTSFSYLWQRDIRNEPATSANLPGFGDTRDALRYHATATHTATFSPRLLNQTVVGFNMLDATAYAVDTSRPSEFGIGNQVSDPIGLPNVNVVGWFQLGHGAAPFGWRDPKWTVRNTFSYVTGQHSIRAGGEWRTWQNRQYGTNSGQFRFDGTFTGNALVDFLTARAATVAAVFGDQTTRLKTDVYGLFVQDDIQLSRRFTLNAGLRWEYYTPPEELQDRDFQVFDEATGSLIGRDSAYRAQKNNIAPRIGFAFDPFGDGKMAIRGGVGLFYNQGTITVARNLVLNPPVTTSITFRGTSLADPFAGQGTAALATLDTVGDEIETPLVRSYNINVQRELMQNTMVEVGYYGSYSRNLELTTDINQAIFIPGQSTAVNTDQRRPYRGYGSITKREFVGDSRYDSLRVALSRRMSAGLSVSGSYVLAKTEDYGSSGTTRPQNNFADREAEKGPADFDVRHRVVVSYIWELPWTFQSRPLQAILGGWQISGASQWQSGSPLNIILSTDNSLTGNRLDRPNLNGDPELSEPLPTQWFNVAAFARPAAGEFGNLPRNVLVGPSFANTDVALIKKFGLPRDVRAEFRAEVYNLTNTTNFGTPNLQFGSATFGQISRTRTIRGDAGSSRQVQLGLKLHF